MIPFDPDNLLNTDTLMAKLGVSREEANKILWDLFDKGIIDLTPSLNLNSFNYDTKTQEPSNAQASKTDYR